MSHPDPVRFVPVSRLYGSVASLLRGAALVLALLFVLRVLLTLAPLRSGPLAVLLRLCEAMVTQAPFAVLVVCLIGLSLLIDEECRSSRRLARALRAAALPMAFAYLLLIPLYGTAQWWRSRAEATALRQGLQSSLQQLRSTRRNVERAASSEQLARIWARLPAGSPPLTRFGSNPRQQRSALVRFLDQVSGILLARLDGVEKRLMFVVLRNTSLYALACLGLAALFYRSSSLDLPSRSRWRTGAGLLPSRRGRRHSATLDHELDLLLGDSGAADGAAVDASEDAAASDAAGVADPPV